MSEPTAQQRAGADVATAKANLANMYVTQQSQSGVQGQIGSGLDYTYLYPKSFPNVCPGCGRCRDCGHVSTPPYQQPYWGYPQFGAITCESDPKVQVTNGKTVFINAQTSESVR